MDVAGGTDPIFITAAAREDRHALAVQFFEYRLSQRPARILRHLEERDAHILDSDTVDFAHLRGRHGRHWLSVPDLKAAVGHAMFVGTYPHMR